MPVEQTFSKQDAVELIAIAQEAPIPGGARQAVARQELYQRFANWYEAATAVTDPVPVPEVKPRKRRTNAEIAAESVKAQDVLA